jgi:hypothetical protein
VRSDTGFRVSRLDATEWLDSCLIFILSLQEMTPVNRVRDAHIGSREYLTGWLSVFFFSTCPVRLGPSRLNHGLTCPVCSPLSFTAERQHRDCDIAISKQHVDERDSDRDGVRHALEDASRFFVSDHVYMVLLCSPRLPQAYCARWSFRDSSATVLGFLQGSHGSISHNSDLRK